MLGRAFSLIGNFVFLRCVVLRKCRGGFAGVLVRVLVRVRPKESLRYLWPVLLSSHVSPPGGREGSPLNRKVSVTSALSTLERHAKAFSTDWIIKANN